MEKGVNLHHYKLFSTLYVHPMDILFLLFPLSIMLGFCSFQGKVFILALPNLVWCLLC